MWKWTNDENIKAIILDIDSLDSEYISYSFKEDLKIYEVSKEEITNDRKERIQIKYVDCVELLYSILLEASFDSTQLIAISSDLYFLKEMMQNHIGTIYTGNIETDKLKNAPDFLNKNISRIFNKENVGYVAEAIFSGQHNSLKKSLLKCQSQILLSDGTERSIKLLFGGRYYPLSRKYIMDDPLSAIILDFKKRGNINVDNYYDSVLCWLHDKSNIDIITYVPQKPQEITEGKFNRFASLKLTNITKRGISLRKILKCESNFIQKYNDAYHRKENVQDAFRVIDDVADKTVVVLDDIYSTGATINEIGRILYENGASNVIAVILAVNQMTESSSLKYNHIKCPLCGGNLLIKINNKGDVFFGCSNYHELNCQKTLSCVEGIRQLKQINKLGIKDILDLEDIY